MPEAAVDEHHGPILRHFNVRPARQLLPMQAEAVAHPVQNAANHLLRGCILSIRPFLAGFSACASLTFKRNEDRDHAGVSEESGRHSPPGQPRRAVRSFALRAPCRPTGADQSDPGLRPSKRSLLDHRPSCRPESQGQNPTRRHRPHPLWRRLMCSYAWSFSDCVSFGLRHELNLQDAFTTDQHFRQAGFNPMLGRPN